MAQHTYIIYKEELQDVVTNIRQKIFINTAIKLDSELGVTDLLKMAKQSTTEFFYVIHSDTEIEFANFDFSFKPPEWDKHFVHIWNNELTVRLYNKSLVLLNPELYTDEQIKLGNVKLKSVNEKITNFPKLDIVYISYDEDYADDNYKTLNNRFPNIIRSYGVKGIYEAHKAAAKLARTPLFYVVDADAEILPTFDFSYYPNGYDTESVHVWYSRNPVNDLTYGYGGVKLFPRQLLLDYAGSPIDFTTSVSAHFKVIPEVSNITRFNTDPFSTWRAGFRECTKLASKLISNHDNSETEARLEVWCTKGSDREFGEYAIMGAKEGADFGKAHKDQPDMLGLINDYNWLEKRFSS